MREKNKLKWILLYNQSICSYNLGGEEKPVLVWRKLGAGGGKIKLRLANFDLDPVETGDLAHRDFIRFLIKDR